MHLQKVISKKTWKKLIFVDVLKVTDENSRIRIRIRIHQSEVCGSGSGPIQKFHGSATLNTTMPTSLWEELLFGLVWHELPPLAAGLDGLVWHELLPLAAGLDGLVWHELPPLAVRQWGEADSRHPAAGSRTPSPPTASRLQKWEWIKVKIVLQS